jgi:signal transduction histidine kinase
MADEFEGCAVVAPLELTSKPPVPPDESVRSPVVRGGEELDQQTRRLIDRLIASERMAMLGQATAQIASHLTNQLSILPLIQLMERQYAHDPELSEFLGLFRESFHQISETVQQLRRVVRYDSIEAPRETVSLGESIRELSAFLRHQRNFPWGAMRLDLREEVTVQSSRIKLHHVLANLLLNAADAIEGVDGGRISVRLSRHETLARIEIEDNGRGIAPHLLPRIWDPSYSTKAGAIHGLGLDLVKRLVDGDGGAVSVRSNPGAQTVFTVELPLAPTSLDAADPDDDFDMVTSTSERSVQRLGRMSIAFD